ncbi:MAG: bifunctional diaminohydroxyphosphoribosylaminopyrimidine deaminase/5-amino-6-(5-phosphoribosylamino)uracil reductase RibD [Sulfurovum sp.]
MNRDNIYMQLAIDKAWQYQGLTHPNPAVGAIVTHKGEILSIEAHHKAKYSHAEVLALVRAYELLSGESIDFDIEDASKSHSFLLSLPIGFFKQCSIYVTLEPCSHIGATPSCASLLSYLNLDRVVIGTLDPIEGHGGGRDILSNVTTDILKDKCLELIEPFLISQKRAFVLFKLAQTSNAKISTDKNGGYLSSKVSLKSVHQMRGVCDTLLIGGNTVRTDRPTLDCRFVESNPPNIKIYSQVDNFDRDIPLFKISDREVSVVDNLNFLDKSSFVIVEGGEGMLNILKDKIDWILIYQTPKLSNSHLTYSSDIDLKFLHQEPKGVDLMLWSRVR